MTSTVPDRQTDSDARIGALEARLAIVEDVGLALSRQLDFEALAELVGERLHTVFADLDLFVALYDVASNEVSFPYEISEGVRYQSAPISAATGLVGKLIRDRSPLMFNDQTAIVAA